MSEFSLNPWLTGGSFPNVSLAGRDEPKPRSRRGIKKVVRIYVSSGPNLCQLSPDKFSVDTQPILCSSLVNESTIIHMAEGMSAANHKVLQSALPRRAIGLQSRGCRDTLACGNCSLSYFSINGQLYCVRYGSCVVLVSGIESRVAVLPVQRFHIIDCRLRSWAELVTIRCSTICECRTVQSDLYFFISSVGVCISMRDQIKSVSGEVIQLRGKHYLYIYLYWLNTKCQPDLSKIVLCL